MKLFLCLGLAAFACAQDPTTTTAAPPAPAPPATPHDTFEYCAQTAPKRRCHGPAGTGPDPIDSKYTTDPSQWLCAGTTDLIHPVATDLRSAYCLHTDYGAN